MLLLLQGGGALGAYQAGVYQALAEHGIEPTWVAGISIGAINSAIIAGNPPERAGGPAARFLGGITSTALDGWADWLPHLVHGTTHARGLVNQFAAGQRADERRARLLFAPRSRRRRSSRRHVGATSCYDTTRAPPTLERLIDFDRINSRETRFSVGSVNVRTGNFAYFDNATIRSASSMSWRSGALPPGFPAVEIDGEYYWDGGMVSNTPLNWVLSERIRPGHADLPDRPVERGGEFPRDLADVAVRMKEIHIRAAPAP